MMNWRNMAVVWLCMMLASCAGCVQPDGKTNQNNKPMKRLEVGDTMPKFSLMDQNGNVFDSQEYVGKQLLVVYFYPKDDSPGCTRQACAIRDQYEAFSDANAKVIGINSGNVESHKAFQEKHNLPFTLLSDPGNKVARAFGVRNFLFLTGRETFVIDREGKIAYTFKGMFKDEEHVEGVLAFLNDDKEEV